MQPAIALPSGSRPINPNWPFDIFDPPLASVFEGEVGITEQLIPHPARHINLSRLRQTFEPRGDIDAVSVNVAFVDDHVAGVDADAQLHPGIAVGPLALGQPALNIDTATNRIDGAVELDQHPVAHAAHQPAAMLVDRGLDQDLDVIRQPQMSAFFIGAHQPAVADDVRQKDGGQSAPQMDIDHPDHRNLSIL